MGGLTVKGGDFYRDGEKTTLVSGTIHYFRVVPDYSPAGWISAASLTRRPLSG